MYQIGQVTKNQISSYLTNITYRKDLVNTEDTIIAFQNPRLVLSGSNVLSSMYTYYLSFKVRQNATYAQDFTVKLKSDAENTEVPFQDIKKFNVKKGNSYSTFEFVFTPNSTFNQVIFELQRLNIDFTGTSRVLNIEITNFSRVNNIISDYLIPKYSGLSNLKKIGIQGKPGLLFTINGEEIRVGRSGIYELYHKDITISYLGFVAIDDDNHFILDFKY
ncbi:MAG: carbohydrate binding domain protein [Caudoviricetes sp.]|nr:MAG: carbohydrate binding domain protein [Caudoviricetes sp.]